MRSQSTPSCSSPSQWQRWSTRARPSARRVSRTVLPADCQDEPVYINSIGLISALSVIMNLDPLIEITSLTPTVSYLPSLRLRLCELPHAVTRLEWPSVRPPTG